MAARGIAVRAGGFLELDLRGHGSSGCDINVVATMMYRKGDTFNGGGSWERD